MVVETPRRFYLILSVWKNWPNRKNVNVFVENIFVIIIKIKKISSNACQFLFLWLSLHEIIYIGTSGWFFAPVA